MARSSRVDSREDDEDDEEDDEDGHGRYGHTDAPVPADAPPPPAAAAIRDDCVAGTAAEGAAAAATHRLFVLRDYLHEHRTVSIRALYENTISSVRTSSTYAPSGRGLSFIDHRIQYSFDAVATCVRSERQRCIGVRFICETASDSPQSLSTHCTPPSPLLVTYCTRAGV